MSIEGVKGTPGQKKLPRERPRSMRCMMHLGNCWSIHSEVGAEGRSQIMAWGG